MAIATARSDSPQLVSQLLSPFDMLSYFETICTAHAYGPALSDKVPIIQDALATMHVSASQCVMIGDTASDIQSGKICSCACTIAVRSGGFDSPYLENLQADYLLSSVDELPSLLSSELFRKQNSVEKSH